MVATSDQKFTRQARTLARTPEHPRGPTCTHTEGRPQETHTRHPPQLTITPPASEGLRHHALKMFSTWPDRMLHFSTPVGDHTLMLVSSEPVRSTRPPRSHRMVFTHPVWPRSTAPTRKRATWARQRLAAGGRPAVVARAASCCGQLRLCTLAGCSPHTHPPHATGRKGPHKCPPRMLPSTADNSDTRGGAPQRVSAAPHNRTLGVAQVRTSMEKLTFCSRREPPPGPSAMSFFQKLVQRFASDVIVKKLANSPTFQRFAYKSVTEVRCVWGGGLGWGGSGVGVVLPVRLPLPSSPVSRTSPQCALLTPRRDSPCCKCHVSVFVCAAAASR